MYEALRRADLTPDELAILLFVDRRSVREVLSDMKQAGMVFRRFFHNHKSGRPDYRYSAFKGCSRYREADKPPELVSQILGDWDSLDIGKVKK